MQIRGTAPCYKELCVLHTQLSDINQQILCALSFYYPHNTMRSLYIVLLLLISITCVRSQEVTLTQPGSALVKPSDPLTLTCKVSVSVTSYYWGWIRQLSGKGLEYMGYIHSGGGTSYTPSLQGRITFTRDTSKNELSLVMSNMRSEDSGTYYCARDTVREGSQGWG
ncbi:hypothetical protein FKM82_029683 [Ascaphus truei]